jgi:O-antigen ligase
LTLLLGIIVLLFPFFHTGRLNKVISFCIIAPSVIYMLKTGSRGVLLGVVVTTLAFLVLTRKRMQALMVLVPLAALSLLMVSPETRHRLTYISVGDRIKVSSTADESDLESQMQREQLFKDSVRITLQNPIFGVGPGEFMVADSGAKAKAGDNAAWRHTHNSYTQVSSEAGLPGFVLYVGSMLVCLGMNLRLYRQTVGRKGLEDFAGISFCMALSMVAYAVCTVFDHLAYLTYLPTLGGITTATYFAAQPALASLQRQVR